MQWRTLKRERNSMRQQRAGGILFCAALLSCAAYGQGVARPEAIDAWKKFRVAQPFQTQVVALSQADRGLPRTLIVSEPAPNVTRIRLANLLGAHAAGCETREWSLMSRGTVTDLVCTVIGTDRPDWPDTLARLQIAALGSTEGAPVISLPVPSRRMLAHSLDVRFGASDLYNWISKTEQRFSSNAIAPSLTLNDLLNGGARGVFTTSDGALVVWVVNRDAALDVQARGEIHRFAVASDLVLGAIANKQAALIVGRARVESLAHLPPLRSETVLLLAGSSEQHLAQSYERNDMLAGKGVDGVDRAPILLSPQLVDTEFGTLLNVADQLLKGWSMAGQVRYRNFNYPTPRSYPFGKTPAPLVRSDRNEFLFNWNTDGITYRQAIAGLDVIAPQRTGALSVIYGDVTDRPRDMEDTAYDYFAQSGDTTLARVVQYTTLYQIFRQLNITSATPQVSARYKDFTENLNQATRRQLKALLSHMSEPQLRTQLTAYWSGFAKRMDPGESASQRVQRDEFIAKRVNLGMTVAQTLREADRASQGEVLKAISDMAATFRLRAEPTAKEETRFEAALQTLMKVLKPELVQGLLQNQGAGLRKTGLLQIAMSQPGGWESLMATGPSSENSNHTAYVVESQALGIVSGGVGGHNLDAPVTRFQVEESLAKGQVRVRKAEDGGWIVDHSSADGDRLRSIAREVGTRKDLSKEQIEAELAKVLKTVRTEPPVALNSIRQAAGRVEDFRPTDFAENAHRVRPLTASETRSMASLIANRHDAIIMEQSPDGAFTLSRTGSGNALQVSSVTSATDAVANGLIATAGGRGNVSIFIKGIPEEKAEAMLSYVQASLRRRSKASVDHVLSSGPDLFVPEERVRLLNDRIANNGLRIERSGVKVSRVSGGAFDGFTRVEIPITVQAKTPWYLRLIFYVKDMSAATAEAITIKASAILSALKGPVSPVDVQVALRRGLQNDLRELNVDAVLLHVDSDANQKVHRVIIAQNDQHTAPIAAT